MTKLRSKKTSRPDKMEVNQLSANIRACLVLDRLARYVHDVGVARAAARAGKSPRWLYRKINGDTPVTLYELELICEAIGIEPAWLFQNE